METSNLIPHLSLPAMREAAEITANQRLRAITLSAPWLRDLDDLVFEIAQQPGSPKAKLNRYRKLADKIGNAVSPHSACKSCSHCCNIAVTIPHIEAQAIGIVVGRKPAKGNLRIGGDHQETIDKNFRTPCPFLKRGRCSIYAERPIACRVHFNLAQDDYFCDPAVPPSESFVANVNLTVLHAAMNMAFMDGEWGDIRDFFPGSS